MLHQNNTPISRRLILIAITLAAGWLPNSGRCAPGDLYETDLASGTVFKFAPDGTQTSFASGLVNATGLAFDKDGNLFAADLGGGAIYKITAAGTKSIFASGLGGPGGLAFDRSGTLFGSDNVGGNIYSFTPDGTM